MVLSGAGSVGSILPLGGARGGGEAGAGMFPATCITASWLVQHRKCWPHSSSLPLPVVPRCLKATSRDYFLWAVRASSDWAACPSHACSPSTVCWRGAACGAAPVGVWGGAGMPQGLFPLAAERCPALRSHHQLQSVNSNIRNHSSVPKRKETCSS